VISEYLYKKSDLEEGEMTKLRASYVCEKALSEYALSLDFSKYIRVGKGEESSGGKFKRTILADTFEAFVGALYLDQGLIVVKDFIDKVVIPIIENDEIVFFNDYKSLLQ
jgi:ribonuclease-3